MGHRRTMVQHRIKFVWLLVAALGLEGCNSKTPGPSDPKAAFRGVTIKVLAPDLPQLLTWLEDQRGEWTAQTGASVEVVAQSGADPTSPKDGLAGSALTQSSIPNADIVIFPATSMANAKASTLATKVPPEVLDATAYEIRDIASAAEHLMTWDRMTYALPLSVETPLVYYRTDLFAREDIRDQFQNKHGRPLLPPQTWDEFDEIVKFFDGSDIDGDGTPDRSLAIASAGESLISRAAAYGKPPQNFSFYFDVTTLEPLADGPAFQLALERWLDVAHCLANDRREDPQLTALTSGRAVFAIGSSRLADHVLRAAVKSGIDKVAGAVGCLPIPGSPRVYLHDRKSWSELPAGKLNRPAVINGLCAAVPQSSGQAAAAYDFLMFLTNRERSLPSVTTASSGFGPYRASHLIDSAAWVSGGWPAASVPSYLAAMRDSVNQPNVVAILRIDASEAFHKSLDAEASAALSGEKTPAEALAAVAESWRRICDERGKDRLRRHYRYSLGLPVVN